MANEYIPFLSKIKEIVKHTETEYTFRLRASPSAAKL